MTNTTVIDTQNPTTPNDTPLYTLTYMTEQGPRRSQPRPAQIIEGIGRIVSHMADRKEAWSIQVTDAAGDDVTSEFACFQD